MIPMTIKDEESKSENGGSSSSGDADKRDNIVFWDLLKNNRSRIKQVEGKGVLLAGDKSFATHGASIYVSAKKTGECHWELSKQIGHDWTKVYLLNYSAKKVTCVQRSDYESDHEFFITVELSGCRFTITDEFVLHIAADVGLSYESGHVRRDKAEQTALKNKAPNMRRRVSITERPGTQPYVARRGEGLVDVATNTLMSAWPENRYTATTLRSIYKEKGASADTITSITTSVVQLAMSEGKSEEDAKIIAAKVKAAAEDALPTMLSIPLGAFIFGLRADSGWNYYALINGEWSDINPVPLSSSSSSGMLFSK